MEVLGERLDSTTLEVTFSLKDSVFLQSIALLILIFFSEWVLSYSSLLPVSPVFQIQCAAAGMTSSACQFPWALSLLAQSPVNTSLLFPCPLTPTGGRFLIVPVWRWLLIAGDEQWRTGSPSIFVCSVHQQWGEQAIPEFPFAFLFHGVWQHDEQSSDAPPPPWS